METKVNNAAKTAANNANNNGSANKGLPVSTAFNEPAKKEEPKKEEVKTPGPEAAKPAAEAAKTEPAKAEAPAPAQEPSKKELKEQLAMQQARRLEETEALVEQLGKKIAQKKKLHGTITNLDEFTVVKDSDDDMASDSRFARCELSITDDEGREFSTKNPFIIAYVAHEVKQLCIDKLAEVEASIVIP